MRVLDYKDLQREEMSFCAYTCALIKAIDSRLLIHRPRDPEKEKLMKELGMEVSPAKIVNSSKRTKD